VEFGSQARHIILDFLTGRSKRRPLQDTLRHVLNVQAAARKLTSKYAEAVIMQGWPCITPCPGRTVEIVCKCDGRSSSN
jgi:hypothetical protein